MPQFPIEFLTPSSQKIIKREFYSLTKEHQQLTSREDSAKEVKNQEMTHFERTKVVQQRINQLKESLKLPVVKVVEQNEQILPGNGARIKINGESFFIVLDGVCVCKRSLPPGHLTVSANSPLGELLMRKKVSQTGSYIVGSIKKNFCIDEIILPSKAQWLLEYENPTVG